MDYEVVDKSGNHIIIKDVIFSDATERVLVLQASKGNMNYFNVDEIVSAVAIKKEESNG